MPTASISQKKKKTSATTLHFLGTKSNNSTLSSNRSAFQVDLLFLLLFGPFSCHFTTAKPFFSFFQPRNLDDETSTLARFRFARYSLILNISHYSLLSLLITIAHPPRKRGGKEQRTFHITPQPDKTNRLSSCPYPQQIIRHTYPLIIHHLNQIISALTNAFLTRPRGAIFFLLR